MQKINAPLRRSAERLLSILMAGALLCCAAPAAPVTAAAADPSVLSIEKVMYTVPAATGGEEDADRLLVDVPIRVDGNEEGFLAAEFGVTYDSRLTVAGVKADAPLSTMGYADSPENDLIWFACAAASPEDTATQQRASLITVTFSLPEDVAVGDQYYIGMTWDGVDGTPSCWYADKGKDMIDEMRARSIDGSITIPDPSAPQLSARELEMDRGSTSVLTVSNYDGSVIWLSDHEDIVTVTDGTVTAHAPGRATVYAYAGTTLLSCDVTVSESYHYSMKDPGEIGLTDPSAEVYLLFPDAVGSISWLSSSPEIVTVERSGLVRGLKNGSAMIFATSNGVTYTRTVTVAYPVQETNDTQTSQGKYPCGDVDNNKTLSIMDVILLNKSLLGGVSLTDSQRACADVMHDGIIDTTDGLTLLKAVVKLVEALPVEP